MYTHARPEHAREALALRAEPDPQLCLSLSGNFAEGAGAMGSDSGAAAAGAGAGAGAGAIVGASHGGASGARRGPVANLPADEYVRLLTQSLQSMGYDKVRR